MKFLFPTLTMAVACGTGYAQTGIARPEFEVVSIKTAEPAGYFHAPDTGTGGPGTADPGTFHCTCTVAALITKAFELQRYQFPGQASLPAGTFDISAKVPTGTTNANFLAMIQNLLKDRFGLAWHYEKREMQGYQLVVAKSGSKLKESDEKGSAPVARPEQHGAYGGASHESQHSGLMSFGGQARYRGDHQTMDDLAHLLSNAIAKPVEDQTGLKGKYDIVLSWSGADSAPHDHQSADGGRGGGASHGDYGGAASGGSPRSDDASSPALFDAVQAQLGLKLVAARKSIANIFIVDRIEKTPTSN